jgi:hypothetical protein
MFLSYMDDSSRYKNKEFNKTCTHKVLAVVMVHDRLTQDIEAMVGDCIEQTIPKDRLEQFEEFHACELYGGYGLFENIDQEARHRAIKRLLKIVYDYKLPVIYGAVDLVELGRRTYASADATDIAFRSCFPGIEKVMDSVQSEWPENALLIVDDGDKAVKDRLKKTYKQLRFHFRPPHWTQGMWFLHDDMYFGSSKDSIGI